MTVFCGTLRDYAGLCGTRDVLRAVFLPVFAGFSRKKSVKYLAILKGQKRGKNGAKMGLKRNK